MVGSGLEDEIGNWVPGNEADISLEGLDFFNFPSVCLEGDGLDEGDWNAKLQDIELYTSDSFLDTSHGDILNAASKLKQEPPSEFAEEAPRTRISAHNGYSDGLDSRNNQAPSPDSVLNSNHSSSGEKGISTSSEDLIRPQPYSSQSHDSSAPRRSKRVASKPVYRSFNYPDFYIPDTVACLGEEQPQKKKKRKLSKVSDTGKVSLCSSQHIKCSCCDATETIQLREGPLGPKMLCNSCGIQYRYGRLFQEYHPSPRTTFDPSPQTRFYMKGGGQEENKAVPESYLVLDEEVPELETESKMSMSSDDFEFHPKGNSSKQKLKKKVKLTMQTSSSSDNQRCSHCDVGKTTQWRLGPMGPRTLCNACGIRYRSGRLFPEYRPADSPTFVPSLHSFSHRKVIELRKKSMQEASRVFKEPILSQPKVRRVQSSVTGTHFISPSKDMKEEAIIATKLPLSRAKEIREAHIQEATNFDVEPPLQPLGAIEDTIFTDSEPQMSYYKDVKEASTFDAVVADSEHLFSLHNDTKKEVSAAIAAPMSLPCKDMKETSFIKPPLVTSMDTEKALNTDIELPNATNGAAVANREPPLHLKAIQEAVEPRTRTSPSKAMEEMVIANGETMLKRKNPVTRIRKKKLPKVSGIAGTSKKPLQKPTETRKCLHCGINKSPLWREGPLGKQTLCNACGIRHASGRLHPEYRPAASPTFVPTLHSSSHKKVVQLRQEEGHYSMLFNSSNV